MGNLSGLTRSIVHRINCYICFACHVAERLRPLRVQRQHGPVRGLVNAGLRGGYNILTPVSQATASTRGNLGYRAFMVVDRAPEMSTNLTPARRSWCTKSWHKFRKVSAPVYLLYQVTLSRALLRICATVLSEITPAPMVDVGSRRQLRSSPSVFRTVATPLPSSVVTRTPKCFVCRSKWQRVPSRSEKMHLIMLKCQYDSAYIGEIY